MLNYILGLIWLAIVIYTIYLVVIGKNPKYLNKLIWVLLLIFLSPIGVILYWILEKKIFG